MKDRVLGDVGSRLLLENDRVRVWELQLEPGEESDLHEHTLDYVLVQVAGDRVAGVFEADSATQLIPAVRLRPARRA